MKTIDIASTPFKSTLKPYLLVVWPGMEMSRIGNRDVETIRFDAGCNYLALSNEIHRILKSGTIVQLVYDTDCARFLNWYSASGYGYHLHYPSYKAIYDYVDQAYREMAGYRIDRDEAFEFATRWQRECEDLDGPSIIKSIIRNLPMHSSALRPKAPKPKLPVRKDHW